MPRGRAKADSNAKRCSGAGGGSRSMSRCLMAKIWHAFYALTKNKKEDELLERSKAKVLTQSLVSVLQLPADLMKDFDGAFPEQHFEAGLCFEEYKEFVTGHLLAKAMMEELEEEVCFENEVEVEEEEEEKESQEDKAKEGKEGSKEKEAKEGNKEKEAKEVSKEKEAKEVSESSPPKRIPWDLLDNVCWTLFSKQALSPTYNQILSPNALHHLWQWFVTFADTDDDGVVRCPVQMDGEELNFWLHYLISDLLALEFSPLPFQQPVGLKFNEALDALLSAVQEKSIDRDELEILLQEFHMEIIDGVMKKGFLFKGKRNLMKSQWKRRYCVLSLRNFAYYTDENMSDKKGQIPLSQIVSADPYRDRNSKLTRYQIETDTSAFILEAEDLRSRNLWIRDIRFAIQCYRKNITNVNFLKAEKRKQERLQRQERARAEEEERQRVAERIQSAEEKNEALSRQIESVTSELQEGRIRQQEEERAAADLQSQLRSVTETMTSAMQKIEEEKQTKEKELEEERHRVQELQALHNELEAALQEEQRLRKHEESVMRMQAALVEEQVQAREKLEAMQVEQEALLGAEIQKRAEIQVKLADQNEKIAATEVQLNAFERQLEDSESQKAELYAKLRNLEQKISAPQVASHRGPGAFVFFKNQSA